MNWSDKLMIFLSGVAAVPLGWIGISIVDVWLHNVTDYAYSAWNFFTFFR